MATESTFIEFAKNSLPSKYPWVEVGIGDDCSVINLSSKQLVTSDMLMDGVHFLTTNMPIELIGRKSLAVSFSDIAAMGGCPRHAYVCIAFPRNLSNLDKQNLFMGMVSLSNEHNVAIAGGDTNTWDGPLVISTTVVGEPHQRGIVLRSGALCGDDIFVTGPLGDSYDSGRHLRFTPRVNTAKAILDRCLPTAMIDLSDGLATDLRHILKASGVGAVIHTDKLPINESLRSLTDSERVRRAVEDGEDFELCLTLTKPSDDLIKKLQRVLGQLFWIGKIDSSGQLKGQQPDGKIVDWDYKGYEHL